jgi:hypothetical protein
MPGAQSTNPVAQTMRDMGILMQEAPMTSAVTGIAAGPGAVAGGELVGQVGENIGERTGIPGAPAAGRALGETVGSLGGGVATAVPAVAAARRARVIPGAEMPGEPTATRPVADLTADPEVSRVVARNTIDREVDAIDRSITRVIESVRDSTGDPRRLSEDLVRGLETVQTQSRGVVQRAWGRTPQNEPVETPNFMAAMREVEAANAEVPRGIPQAIINRIRAASEIPEMPGVLQPLTLRQLRAFASDLNYESRIAGGTAITGFEPNNRLRASIARMNEAMDEDIALAFPGNPAVAEARAITREYHDRFTRGPVAEILSRTPRGGQRVVPAEAIETLLASRQGGPAGVAQAASPLGGEAIPGGPEATFLTDQAIRARYAQVVEEARASAAVTTADPRERAGRQTIAGARAGSRFARESESMIENFARATSTVQNITRFQLEMARAREIAQNSALSKFGMDNPRSAVAEILGSDDPVATTRAIIRGFNRTTTAPDGRVHRDPVPGLGEREDAMEGLGRSMTSSFLDRATTVTAARDLLQSPQGHALRLVLGDERFERFSRLVQTVSKMEAGEGPPGERVLRNTGSWMSRIFGLHVGGGVARTLMTGAQGQLSLPARMSNAFSNYWLSIFPALNPRNALVMGTFDPSFEQFLHSRLPSNMREVQGAVRHQMANLRRAQSLMTQRDNDILGGTLAPMLEGREAELEQARRRELEITIPMSGGAPVSQPPTGNPFDAIPLQ